MTTAIHRAHVLSESEQARVITVIGKRSRFPSRDTAIFALSLCAGLRVGEIAGLDIDDVAEYGQSRAKLFSVKPQTMLTKTKGNKPRQIFLDSPVLGKALENYLPDRLALNSSFMKRHPDAERPLFLTQKNHRFSTPTLCQLFRRFYGPEWADVKDAKGHSGRRTYITNLAEQGINLKFISLLAGHSNISTTSIYVDANPLLLKRIAASATNPKLQKLL